MADSTFAKRASAIRWVFFDVDGVLTDGSLFYGPDGEVFKRFHVLDGHGLVMLREAGLGVGLCSGRDHAATRQRAAELGLSPVFMGVKDKLATLQAWASSEGLPLSALAHMGDDLPDLPVLQAVGLGATVPGGVPAVKGAAHFCASLPAGQGAVREFCDALLKARQGSNPMVASAPSGPSGTQPGKAG